MSYFLFLISYKQRRSFDIRTLIEDFVNWFWKSGIFFSCGFLFQLQYYNSFCVRLRSPMIGCDLETPGRRWDFYIFFYFLHFLGQRTNTIKAPNSKGFPWKIFFISIFLLGDTLAKKFSICIKSGSVKCQNQNFDFVLLNPEQNFSESVEVTRQVPGTSVSWR